MIDAAPDTYPTTAPAVRLLTVADADELFRLQQQVVAESNFLLRDPIEDAFHIEDVHRQFAAQKSNDVTLGAAMSGRLVGYLEASGGTSSRSRATARLSMAVASLAQGRGIGRALLKALDGWALNNGVHRLELMVITDNATAIRLYERCGYQREHIRRHTMRVGGRFVDQWSMAKLLPWPGETSS